MDSKTMQQLVDKGVELAPRYDSVTREPMWEGWYFDGLSGSYVKHEHMAIAICKANGYEGLDDAFEDEFVYWTDWNDIPYEEWDEPEPLNFWEQAEKELRIGGFEAEAKLDLKQYYNDGLTINVWSDNLESTIEVDVTWEWVKNFLNIEQQPK